MERIHLNNAGAGALSQATIEAICDHLKLEERIGGYEAADEVQEKIDQLRAKLGKLVQFEPAEIALTDSATRAWNTIVYGLSFQPGDVVVVSRLEFGSNLASLIHWFGRQGVKIELAPSDSEGRVDVGALASRWPTRTRLLAITHAPAHAPLLNPIEELADLAARNSVPILIDACQSLGIVPFPRLNGEFVAVSGTGRKWLRGPRGTGFLAVRGPWIETISPPTAELANTNPEDLKASQLRSIESVNSADRFELWEKSTANLLGLSNAVSELETLGIETHRQKIIGHCDHLKSLLSREAQARLVVRQAQQTGIVAFSIDDLSATKRALAAKGINSSANGKWDAPLDFEARSLDYTLRISPAASLTDKEVAVAAAALNDIFAGT